ncbi:MAG: hypothetical protein NT150_00035 [Bacteroidetes bacterium]|nr:hypothetical protein [Bacteroidota bacterium]
MRFNLLYTLVILTTISAGAQSKFKVGLLYNTAASSYYGSNNMGTMTMPQYSLKISLGAGIKAEYAIKNNWGINLFSAWQQRGAYFDEGVYSFAPHYSFDYIDAGLGVYYQTKEIIGKSKLKFTLAGTYHTLISSERINNYESSNIISDSQMSDYGILASIGLSIPRADRDDIQISSFVNTGFKNVFGGVLEMNGQSGKNILFGIQLAYLFGFNKKINN